MIVVGRIRNVCRTEPVDFGNATLSLPANNLSRPHGGGNITNLYILHDNSGRVMVSLHQFLNVVLKAIHQTTVEFVFPVVLENYFVQFSIRDF